MYGLSQKKGKPPLPCKRSMSGISVHSSPERAEGDGIEATKAAARRQQQRGGCPEPAEEQGSETTKAAAQKDVMQQQWEDPSKPTVVRVYQGMGRVEAKMRKSTSGFLVASFPDGEFETEMPNLLLDKAAALLKRPAAAAEKKGRVKKAKKRKSAGKAAAAEEEGQEEEEEEEEKEEEEQVEEEDQEETGKPRMHRVYVVHAKREPQSSYVTACNCAETKKNHTKTS